MKTEDTAPCHVCGHLIESWHAQEYFVSSDCKPVKGHLLVAECTNCGVVQKQTNAEWQKSCDAIYAAYDIYHQAGGEEQKVFGIDGEFSSRSSLLVKFLDIPPKGDVMDVGCGNGALLKAFHDKHPAWSKHGSDINENMKESVEAIPASFSTELKGSYDIISLIHCIEHISGPIAFLKNVATHLKPGGSIFIQVPDNEANPFDLTIADHASHFSKSSLRSTVESAGFTIVSCANSVLAKEITLVAKVGQSKPEIKVVSILEKQLAWLRSIESDIKALDKPVGMLGSSIAATWAASINSGQIGFFVDEDSERIGKSHMSREIVHPSTVKGEVYAAVAPLTAKAIIARYPDIKWITPRA